MTTTYFWQEQYESLPADKQEEIDGWMGTNMFIATEGGVTPDEWMKLLQDAHKNPEDTSYLTKVEVFTNTDKLDDGDDANTRAVATKLGGPQKDLASIPKVGEEKPEGSLSLSMLNFPRRS